MRTTYSNRLHLESFYQSVTPYIFFALFGGFILYQLAVAYRFIPPFLGGYFGIASAVVAIFYFFRIPKILQYNFSTNKVLTFTHCSIFIYALIVTILAVFENTGQLTSAINQSFNTLIIWFSLFSLGFYFLRSDTYKSIKLNYILSYFFLGFILFYLITTKSVMLNLTTISNVDSDDVTGYQSLARNLLVISLFLVSFSRNTIAILLLLLSFIFIFFFLGARSEFVAFLLVSAVFMLLRTMHHAKYLIITILSIMGAAALFLIFQESIMESRQFQLFNYSDSSSWNAREYLKEVGVRQIAENPVFGLFGGHSLSGDAGNYIHNSLSGYVNYGLYFYLGYMFLCIFITIDSLLKVLVNKKSNAWLYVFLINFACLFLVLFAKPVFWGIPFFAWGLYFSAKSMIISNKKAPH